MEDGEGGCGRGPLGGAGGTQHWELGTHEGSTVHQQLLRWGEEEEEEEEEEVSSSLFFSLSQLTSSLRVTSCPSPALSR